ncbi:MAG: N-acetylmuramoyl-L-alanine amidase [Firmicutes bacterium]|nr:N-acetylmuramoyl-L-alanine amidase [Candidatus Fermentithermobacillaceae bacterium]
MKSLNLLAHPNGHKKVQRKKTQVSSAFSLAVIICLLSANLLAATPVLSASETPSIPPDFAGFKGIVVGDACNLRTGPGTDYPSKGLVLQGTWLDILTKENNWLKVKYKNDEVWIADWLVDIDLSSHNIKAVISKADVNIRQGPGTDYPVIGLTQKGYSYYAEAKRGDWIRFSLGTGKAGWVRADLLDLLLPSIKETEKPAGDMVVRPRSSTVTVYQFPLKGSATMATIAPGNSAKYITSRGAWIAVETSSGTRGWVYGPDTVITLLTDPALSFGVSESSWSMGKYSTIVVNATNVNFRSGPGTTYPVISMVQKGDTLRVLETEGQWIKCISPKGIVGWIASWLTAGTPGKSPGFSVSLDISSSVRVFTVQGPFESSSIASKEDDKVLEISTSSSFGTSGRLDINFCEFQSIKVEGNSVVVSFQEKPSYVIKEQNAGKLVLVFSPVITSVTIEPGTDGETLEVKTLGYAWPTMHRNGSSINMFLPGASYSGEISEIQGNLVKATSISSQQDGVTLSLDASQSGSYLLRKNPNSLEAMFHNPGLSGKTIVIDPGHGGTDPGASGPTGYAERVANWEIAIRLKKLLEDAGATVIMTRHGIYEGATPPEDWNPDIDEYSGDLAKRTAWSQKAHAFVSIHNDAHADRSIAGTTSYICENTLNVSESRRLAQLIQGEVTRSVGTYDRGIRTANFFVNRESLCPSVLVEVMYLSNPREEQLLKQAYIQDAAALGIFNALKAYFSPGTTK